MEQNTVSDLIKKRYSGKNKNQINQLMYMFAIVHDCAL